MQSTDLGNKESGKIWHRKPSPATHDGIIVNIVHSTSEYHPKVLRFLNVAFDGSGESFIAGDHQGNIYVFDLHGNSKVFFLPLSNTILSCFKDNSIFAWECDTLFCKYQLPGPPEGSSILYKVFAVTRDGRILAAGGKSNHLHLWCLEARQLFRIIQMPTKVRAARHLEFLPESFDAGSNQVLGVLSQDGIMRFVNIQTCKLLFEIGTVEDGISSSVISPHGRYIASIMENGSLNVYSVQALTQEINKPPPPLVKVIEDLPNNTVSSSNLKMKIMSGRVQRPARCKESKIQTQVLKQDLTGSLENKENELSEGLNKKRLQILLKGYGEYPTKYRMFIWRSLLQLPENHTAFILQRTLSALAHWSAIFSDMPYLPLLAFPFVKLFQNNQLICFEVVATLIRLRLVNWCQHWFEYFPNPPINILSMIENVLAFHDKELLQHFIDRDITSQVYAWPLLETLFSEVLTREEWLRLFDNIFSNHPSFLLMTVVAYSTCSRAPLLNCTLKEDFERQYPIFNQYPKFIVDYQTQERERIRNDELDFLRERQTVENMQAEVDEQRAKDDAWYQKQELLRRAEETRREILLQEEEKMAQQRHRLAAVKRELEIKEIHLQDAARRRLLQLHQDQREMELRRLEDEIERKVHMRDREIAATAKDLEIRQLELEAQKRLYEKDLTTSQEAVAKEIREDTDAHRRKVALEEHMFQKLLENSQMGSRRAQRVMEDSLAKAEQACLNADWQIQTLHKQKCEDRQRSQGYYEVATLLRKNRRKEVEVLKAMMEEEAKKMEGSQREGFRLQSEKKTSALSDASRKWFLRQETSAALEHEGAEVPWLQRQRMDSAYLPPTSRLKDVSDMDPSTHIFSRNKPTEWNHLEHDLLKNVRNLRRRLTARARSSCGYPQLLVT
ncbi:TBC1 domain family member 31 [Apodemus speciosus]|uniref:TBC1 domain family member 31 n=1 Tax=Apodemus speciosus TaxID=105296 RepID=A0ABQ0FJF9_APOSI